MSKAHENDAKMTRRSISRNCGCWTISDFQRCTTAAKHEMRIQRNHRRLINMCRLRR